MLETQQRTGGSLLSVDTDVAGFNNAISGPGRDAIQKLDLARLALERAGNEAADALVAAQAHAPAPATWYETAGPTILGLTSNTNPKVKAELAAGAVRGVLDVVIVRLPTRPYLDQALDLWSKKHGINPNSGIHSTARIVAPAVIPIPGVAAGLGITTKLANRSLTRVIEATPAEVATRTATSTAEQVVLPGLSGVAANRGLVGSVARLTESEVATGTRLAQAYPDRIFNSSPHVGAEYVDDLGRSYDAVGSPAASRYWSESQFLRSIDSHLLKSNIFTVVDLTGFSSEQISVVRAYIDGLSTDKQSMIIRIGF